MTRLTLSLHMAQKFHAGLKTQTRRVSPPKFNVGDVVAIAEPCTISISPCRAMGCASYLRCEYAAGGRVTLENDAATVTRCAKMKSVQNATPRSARFMPGWAERSRIRITEIREERLGDITEADAIAEGFTDRAAFLAYFGTLHKGPIDLTRPVWAISFEVVT